MKILFVTKIFLPHIGGVEKQVAGLSKKLISKGHPVTVLTENYDGTLKEKEIIDGIKVIRVRFPHIKYLGLIYTWFWFIFHTGFLSKFDIIHFHGSFIWYWIARFFHFNKPVYVTFHGAEWRYPIPFKNRLIRQIDAAISTKNIAISGYLQKWYTFKADDISYTSLEVPRIGEYKKDYKKILYVGRLEENTGLRKILSALKKLNGFMIDFCGDGPLRKDCEEIGEVHGFTNPDKYFRDAFICVSPGITSILEALSYKCLVITTYPNLLIKDYLLTNPFSTCIIVERSPEKMARAIQKYSKHPELAREKVEGAYEWVKTQNWENEDEKILKTLG